MSERIQKYLAGLGHGSRRQIEAWLQSGNVVDASGKPYSVGQRVGSGARIFMFGKEVEAKPNFKRTPRVLAYHKPAGEISSTSDPAHRSTIYDRLPSCGNDGKWVSIGRLDINSTGLILFSNDGGLVHALTHPSSEIVREYRCRIWGRVDERKLARLKAGVRSKSELLRFDDVKFLNSAGGSNSWYRVVIRRGRNREIRRTWESVGCKVSRLIRIRYGSVELPQALAEGDCQELRPHQVSRLVELAGLKRQEREKPHQGASRP